MKVYPNQERLKELFDYYEETGNFIRKIQTSSRARVSYIAGNKDEYIRIRVDGVQFYSHRLAWIYMNGDIPEGLCIDHINGIKYDNRISNLRIATLQQNAENRRTPQADSSTGFLGVTFDKSLKKFRAQIMVAGKQKSLGYFSSAELAHEAYLEAKRKYHEFSTI